MDVSALLFNIPLFIAGGLGFGFLVGFHELGHFLFCKLFGVKTPSFSIGFGPQILKKQIGETLFTLSAIPFGGYVEIAGADEPGQGEQKDRKSFATDSFAIKSYYQKMLIIAGGILFNLIFSYGAMIAILAIGAPKTPLLFPQSASNLIEKILDDSPAQQAGLKAGDTILAITAQEKTYTVKESTIATFMQKFLQTLSRQRGQEVSLLIMRDGQSENIKVTVGDKGLGITFDYQAVKATTWLEAITMGVQQVNFWIYSTGEALSRLFKEKTVKGIGGPVMVISQMIKGAEKGFVIFVIFLAFISVNLAVMNLIPLPVFDGGQALFYTIEAIIGRPLPESMRNGIAYGTWFCLILLICWITIQDILVLIKPYFG